MSAGEPLSRVAPDSEFIGAGDDVVVLNGVYAGVEGVLIDAADPTDAEVRVTADPKGLLLKPWPILHVAFGELAHPDSPQAEAVALYGEAP